MAMIINVCSRCCRGEVLEVTYAEVLEYMQKVENPELGGLYYFCHCCSATLGLVGMCAFVNEQAALRQAQSLREVPRIFVTGRN